MKFIICSNFSIYVTNEKYEMGKFLNIHVFAVSSSGIDFVGIEFDENMKKFSDIEKAKNRKVQRKV